MTTEYALDKTLKTLALLGSDEAVRSSKTMAQTVILMKGLLAAEVPESDIVDTFAGCKPIAMTALPVGKKGAYVLGVYIKNVFQPVNPLVTLHSDKDQKGEPVHRLIAQLSGSPYTLSFYTDLDPKATPRDVGKAVLNDAIVAGMFVPPPLLALPTGDHAITAIVPGEKTDVITVKLPEGEVRVRVQKSGLKVGSTIVSEGGQLFEGDSAVAISFSEGNLIDFMFVEGKVYSFKKFSKLGTTAVTCIVVTPEDKEILTWCPRKFPIDDVPRGTVLKFRADKVVAGTAKNGKPNQTIDWSFAN